MNAASWRCARCGSPRWVGWRAGPAHHGFTRYAQCVPCGHVQAPPKEEPDMPEPDSGIAAAEQFNIETNERTEQLAREHQAQGQRWLHRQTMARFAHHPPTAPNVIQAHEQARTLGAGFAQWLLMFLPDCDERDKAMDALDLTVMHANAAIARTQLKGAWHSGKPPEPPSQP